LPAKPRGRDALRVPSTGGCRTLEETYRFLTIGMRDKVIVGLGHDP